MRIVFVRTQAEADATLNQLTINEIAEHAHHPVAKRKGLREAIFPLAENKDVVYKVYNPESMGRPSPFMAFVNDKELTDKVVAEISGEPLPQATKKSSKKSK